MTLSHELKTKEMLMTIAVWTPDELCPMANDYCYTHSQQFAVSSHFFFFIAFKSRVEMKPLKYFLLMIIHSLTLTVREKTSKNAVEILMSFDFDAIEWIVRLQRMNECINSDKIDNKDWEKTEVKQLEIWNHRPSFLFKMIGRRR